MLNYALRIDTNRILNIASYRIWTTGLWLWKQLLQHSPCVSYQELFAMIGTLYIFPYSAHVNQMDHQRSRTLATRYQHPTNSVSQPLGMQPNYRYGCCHLSKLALDQRTITVGRRITVLLVSSLTRLDVANKENMLFLYVVKQLNPNWIQWLKLPPTVNSVLCLDASGLFFTERNQLGHLRQSRGAAFWSLQPVWPYKNRQMSIKVAQKWFH